MTLAMPKPSPASAPDFAPRIRRVLAALAPSLPTAEPQIQQLGRYLQLVHEWNGRMDLTAARTHDELVDLFIADAARLADVCAPHLAADARWVDVGSGAGAPGLPLKLLLPELQLTLVEPLSKRVAFLRTVVGTLGLSGVSVRRARVEACGDAEFEVALSRATLKPEAWLGEGGRIAKHQVWVLLAKDAAPTTDGWQREADVNYQWPLTHAERRLLSYRPKG